MQTLIKLSLALMAVTGTAIILYFLVYIPIADLITVVQNLPVGSNLT